MKRYEGRRQGYAVLVTVDGRRLKPDPDKAALKAGIVEILGDDEDAIVDARRIAAYENKAAKPNSGGPQLKFKFVATLSAVVAKINAKRSVEVGLLKGRSLVSCGNVTIPANHEIPPVGAVVEVRYLYAFRDSLALHQPVYLGPRDDVEAGECLASQLKFKA